MSTMIPVEQQGEVWVMDPDPLLDGDDVTQLADVDHLPTKKIAFSHDGVTIAVTVYLVGDSAGYVRSDDVPTQMTYEE